MDKTFVAGVKRSGQLLRQGKVEAVIGTRLSKPRCPVVSSPATYRSIGFDRYIERGQITERDSSFVRSE